MICNIYFLHKIKYILFIYFYFKLKQEFIDVNLKNVIPTFSTNIYMYA
jgi:hypothetical protein